MSKKSAANKIVRKSAGKFRALPKPTLTVSVPRCMPASIPAKPRSAKNFVVSSVLRTANFRLSKVALTRRQHRILAIVLPEE